MSDQLTFPLVAILRGITPDRATSVANALYRAGIRALEVTFNSPDPLASIAAITTMQLEGCLVGAGTVLSVDDVQRTYDVGGRLIVTPNCDGAVIAYALQQDMVMLPGIATPTEAFAAIKAGAIYLKLFPATTYGAAHLKALKAVLPAHIKILPVGGVSAADIAAWVTAGADGFGFGSELFRPEYSLSEIEARAQQLVQAYHRAILPT